MTNEGAYVKSQLDKKYAAKDSAIDALVSYIHTGEAVASTSLVSDIRNTAVRVRWTKIASNGLTIKTSL